MRRAQPMETGSDDGRSSSSRAAIALAKLENPCGAGPLRKSQQKPDQTVALLANHCLKSNSTSNSALPLLTNTAIHIAYRDVKCFNLHSDLSIIIPMHETTQRLKLAQLDLQCQIRRNRKGPFPRKIQHSFPQPLLTCMGENQAGLRGFIYSLLHDH